MAAIETFPERCQFGTWDERYQALKEDCRSRTETASQKLEAQGVKAIEDGRLADMEKILETLQKNFPEGHATRARDAFDALKERVDETRRRERVLRIKRYKEFYALHERELKERRYQEFLDAAQKCQGDPDYEVLRAEMKMETEHGRMLLQLLQYVEEGAKKRLNKPFQLLGQSLTLMGVEAGNLVLRMGRDGPQMRVSIARKLKTQDILNLAQGEIAGDPNGKIMTGAFYFAEGDLPKAREQWMASAEEGKDVKLALWTIDVLGRDEREVEAQESISKIQGRFEGCKWDEVVQLIDEARKAHEGTAALNQARADLNRMMAEAKNRSGKTTAAAGPEGDRSRRIPLGRVETSNGLEQYMDWRHLAWPTGSGRGTLGFTGLKGQDDPNRVMQFRFQDVAGKIFLGREAAMDFSARKRLLVQVRNPSRTRIKMSLALCTGPRFEYYESPIECDLPAESARAHRFRLQASDFKCAASGWNWTSRVTDLQDVRRVVFVIHTEKQDGELIFEHIGLVD
jgi:hypothetical protein